MMKPAVYAFYESIRNRPVDPLLMLWLEKWNAAGYFARVLTMKQAVSHPRFWEMAGRIWNYPTINDRDYESLCYARWCAAAGLPEWSIVMDYDVFPNPSNPPDFSAQQGYFGTFSVKGEPMAMAGDGPGFENIVSAIIDFNPGDLRHISDMVITCGIDPKVMPRFGGCALYNHDVGWSTSPLIHFATYTTGKSKLRTVEKTLAELSK